MTEELPVGLKPQIHEGRAAPPNQQLVTCEWCHRSIDVGERINLYVYRTPNTPWMAESASCADCGDDRVVIPTAGCDEVMVSCILRRGGDQDGFWYDLTDADLLDRAGPAEGSDVSEGELEAYFESIPGADGRGDRR